MSITAIIATYNSAGVIESALRSVHNHPEVSACIVVDNASTDSTVEIIRTQFPETEVIVNVENLGFGAACNQALDKTTSEFAFLLNPDSTIDSHGIDTLLEGFASHPNASIIAPVLSEHSFRSPLAYDKKLPIVEGDKFSPVTFVSGAMCMWKMVYMKQVGFFDPAFFLFFEDDDISIRTHKGGYDMFLVSGINAHHIPGRSCVLTPEIESLKLRSSTWSYLYIHAKYKGQRFAKRMAFFMLMRGIVKKYLYWLKGGRQQAFARGNEKVSASLALKQAMHEKKHHRQRDNALKTQEKRWARIMQEQENIQAAAFARHEETITVSDNKLKAEWESAAQAREMEQAAQISAFEKPWEGILDRHDSTFADALAQLDKEYAIICEGLNAMWTEIEQKHKAGQQLLEEAHERRWMEKMKQQGTALAVVAKQHEAEWAVVAKELETQRNILVRKQEGRKKVAAQEYEGKWMELTKTYEQKRQQLTVQREGEWVAMTREFETGWIAMTRTHEQQRKTVMDMYERQWSQKTEEYERMLAELAQKHDTESVAAMQVLAEKYEKTLAAAIAESDAAWAAAQSQRENEDRLWAILHFMRSPGKFLQ